MNKKMKTPKTLAEIAAELRGYLTDSGYSVEQLQRIYIHTNICDYFCVDNPSNCDTGSENKIVLKKLNHRKKVMKVRHSL